MSNTITLVRGDSDTITVAMSDTDGVAIPFETGDTLYFTVKIDTSTTAKVFQKTITSFTDGVATISIVPSDTSSLSYGTYVYDIQWTQDDGTKTTIVPASQFIVADEVTYE